MASGGHDDQRHDRHGESRGSGPGGRDGVYRPMGESGTLTVGSGIRLRGEITACRTLVVEGEVAARLEAESLLVSSSGRFEGEARVARAEIAGRFDGDLSVEGLLLVRGGARLDGTIRYHEIEVERGARLHGDWGEAEGAPAVAGRAAPLRGPGPVAPARSQVSARPTPAPGADRPALDFLRGDSQKR
ncbi:MAG: polymer-forming cytoskeletal protein [Rhodospirillaceae bacterium]|jgi:cytoskeletal protein CcmA (bactofilin family)|nr:polymer-forming cytoskeletal protein [Rhodospirillaceae bacterium]MBT6118680.1 polymer-forming cytoskeletal protein [Rhodospirillaceae bacterium]